MTISKKSALLLCFVTAAALVLFVMSYVYPVPGLAFPCLTIAAGLLYSLFIKFAILGPLKEISGALKGASSEANLTKRLKVRGGEMGAVAGMYNSFMDEITKTVGEARSAADAARRAASEATLNTDASYEGAKGVSGRVKDVSASIAAQARGVEIFEEISALLLDNYEYLSARISEAADAIDKITASKEAGERNLSALLEKKCAEAGRSGQAAAELDSLNALINQIPEIVGEIKDAAARGIFLSARASSEASGAGEYGRGTAAVADAFSDLAARSSEAASGIEKIIAAMGGNGSSGAEAVADVIKISEEQSARAKEARRAFSEISSEIDAANAVLGSAHKALAALAPVNAKIRDGVRAIQDIGLENIRSVE